jgi:hypothetical protein
LIVFAQAASTSFLRSLRAQTGFQLVSEERTLFGRKVECLAQHLPDARVDASNVTHVVQQCLSDGH